MLFSQKDDEIDAVDNSFNSSESTDSKKTEAHIYKDEEDESPLLSKLSFWEDVTGARGRSNPVNIGIARKSFRKKSSESSLLRTVVSKRFSPKIGSSKSGVIEFYCNYESNITSQDT